MLVTVLAVCALFAVVALGLALATACSNVQVSVFVWPTLVRCGLPSAVMVRAVDDALGNDLDAPEVSPKTEMLLEDIARDTSATGVACALHQLVKIYLDTPGASPLQLSRGMRADKFLQRHNIAVEYDPGPGVQP